MPTSSIVSYRVEVTGFGGCVPWLPRLMSLYGRILELFAMAGDGSV
ncbi:hypothetical protein SAMN04488504_101839 [Myxococcus virescens]|nr:hypothetical protein SAMN04488504_101839 [Myxococcus virescens]